jgi:flagellar biosynthesis protein FliQ
MFIGIYIVTINTVTKLRENSPREVPKVLHCLCLILLSTFFIQFLVSAKNWIVLQIGEGSSVKQWPESTTPGGR